MSNKSCPKCSTPLTFSTNGDERCEICIDENHLVDLQSEREDVEVMDWESDNEAAYISSFAE